MIQRSIEQIASMIKIENDISKVKNIMIKGVAFDSRMVQPGNLFVPLKGNGQADGHNFVKSALDHGAAAVLWQKDQPHPPEDAAVLIVEDTLSSLQQLASVYRNQVSPLVVGITGSNGKTTTKDIAASVLSEKYVVHKTGGNFNNHIGLPITILSMSEKTEVAILEMGMSGKGEISLLTKIARPDIAIITNIGEAHLQDLGSREAIAEAKLEIVEGVAENGVLIYPGNEPLLQQRVAQLKNLRTFTFGDLPEYDLYPEQILINDNGSSFVAPPLSEERFSMPIAGKYNIFNALAVLLAARELSIPVSAMKSGLKSVQLSNMRMEWHQGIKGSKILNDAYNASPTAMRAVIQMVENLDPTREKILVLGDMLELGEQEQEYHKQIGAELDATKTKYVFTYGPLGKYIAEAAREQFPNDRVFAFTDKTKLTQALQEKMKGNEIILFKASRGMKLEEVIHNLTIKN